MKLIISNAVSYTHLLGLTGVFLVTAATVLNSISPEKMAIEAMGDHCNYCLLYTSFWHIWQRREQVQIQRNIIFKPDLLMFIQ